MLIAQVTDIHMTAPGGAEPGGYDPLASLLAVLERVIRARPDVVLFTGDLTEHGQPEEYAAFRAGVAGCALRMIAVPGNHDHRAAFAEAFADGSVRVGTGPHLNVAVEEYPLRLLGLDTLGPEGTHGGQLCATRLAWLAARLDEDRDRPVLIFLHHPPFPTGIGFMDAIGLENPEPLAGVVAGHGAVAGVCAGHVHRAVQTAWAGTTASICPSVAYQVPLDLAPDAPETLAFQRPGFQLHAWDPDRGLITHTEFLT